MLEHSARAGHRANGLRKEVAVAVGQPDRVEPGRRILPGDVIAAGRLHRPDRRPATELAGRYGGATIFQLRTRATTDGIEEVISRRPAPGLSTPSVWMTTAGGVTVKLVQLLHSVPSLTRTCKESIDDPATLW